MEIITDGYTTERCRKSVKLVMKDAIYVSEQIMREVRRSKKSEENIEATIHDRFAELVAALNKTCDLLEKAPAIASLKTHLAS